MENELNFYLLLETTEGLERNCPVIIWDLLNSKYR